MTELALAQVRPAIDIVHDLKLGPGQARRMEEPLQERARLVLITKPREGSHREGGITNQQYRGHPVALAAYSFRKRGGRRGDNRPGERKGHELQNDRAAQDCVSAGSFVDASAAPASPPPDSGPHTLIGRFAKRDHAYVSFGVAEGDITLLTGAGFDAAHHGGVG